MHTDGELSAYLKSTGLLLDKQLDALKIDLFHDDITIGRGESNNISIAARTISKQHAMISHENNHWFIEDLNSKAGVKLNDKRINSRSKLKQDDIVSIGGAAFVFGLNEPEILLRQDTIIMHAAQLQGFKEQSHTESRTLHLNKSDLPFDLKLNKFQSIKRNIKDLFKFKKRYIIAILVLWVVAIAYTLLSMSVYQ